MNGYNEEIFERLIAQSHMDDGDTITIADIERQEQARRQTPIDRILERHAEESRSIYQMIGRVDYQISAALAVLMQDGRLNKADTDKATDMLLSARETISEAVNAIK